MHVWQRFSAYVCRDYLISTIVDSIPIGFGGMVYRDYLISTIVELDTHLKPVSRSRIQRTGECSTQVQTPRNVDS